MSKMDTRFWGPSGWRLIHIVSFAAPSLPHTHVRTFLKNLPYVLPCKFCRASLTDYYAADPIPQDSRDMAKWMYRVHNRVNGKLRDQNLLDTQNPPWDAIRNRYEAWLHAPCSRRKIIGWDFLFSVAYTTPCPQVVTSPMPGAPPVYTIPTPELRNRWGVMTTKERIPYIQAWWETLPHILPFPEWRSVWKTHVSTPRVSDGRKAVTAWLYTAEKKLCSAMNDAAPHDSFTGLCSELSTFTSGCGKRSTRRMKTCRAIRSHARTTLKTRRQSRYKAIGGFL